MKPGAPWSVKGIDPKAREVAKTIAHAQGKSLGDWMTEMILAANAAPRPTATGAPGSAGLTAPGGQVAAAANAATGQAAAAAKPAAATAAAVLPAAIADSRLVAALTDLSRRLEQIEQRVTVGTQSLSRDVAILREGLQNMGREVVATRRHSASQQDAILKRTEEAIAIAGSANTGLAALQDKIDALPRLPPPSPSPTANAAEPIDDDDDAEYEIVEYEIAEGEDPKDYAGDDAYEVVAVEPPPASAPEGVPASTPAPTSAPGPAAGASRSHLSQSVPADQPLRPAQVQPAQAQPPQARPVQPDPARQANGTASPELPLAPTQPAPPPPATPSHGATATAAGPAVTPAEPHHAASASMANASSSPTAPSPGADPPDAMKTKGVRPGPPAGSAPTMAQLDRPETGPEREAEDENEDEPPLQAVEIANTAGRLGPDPRGGQGQEYGAQIGVAGRSTLEAQRGRRLRLPIGGNAGTGVPPGGNARPDTSSRLPRLGGGPSGSRADGQDMPGAPSDRAAESELNPLLAAVGRRAAATAQPDPGALFEMTWRKGLGEPPRNASDTVWDDEQAAGSTAALPALAAPTGLGSGTDSPVGEDPAPFGLDSGNGRQTAMADPGDSAVHQQARAEEPTSRWTSPDLPGGGRRRYLLIAGAGLVLAAAGIVALVLVDRLSAPPEIDYARLVAEQADGTQPDPATTPPAASGAIPAGEARDGAAPAGSSAAAATDRALEPQRPDTTDDGSDPISALRLASDEGNTAAAYELGLRLLDGIGVRPDPVAAVAQFQRAADMGYAPAQFALGVAYQKGLGIERDLDQAAYWYAVAADQGNPDAQFNFGTLYARGEGVDQDYFQAARWYQRAADAGLPDAQFNFANMLERGLGVVQDPQRAYHYFALAAAAGDPVAAERRRALSDSLPAETVARLDRELKQAQEQARADEDLPDLPVSDTTRSKADPAENPPAGQRPAASAASDAPETTPPTASGTTVNGAAAPGPASFAASTDDASSVLEADPISPLSQRDDIAEVQDMLNVLGFAAGPADGVIGGRTRTAIAAFQEAAGLPVDGNATYSLLAELRQIVGRQ